MKTAACFLFHIPARFIHAPGFTFWPATSAWSLWRRLTAARRYSRCCGTKSTLRKNAESAPLRASAEDRARALTPCMETCSLKILHVFIVPPHSRQFAMYLQRKSQSKNRNDLQGAGSRRLPRPWDEPFADAGYRIGHANSRAGTDL